MRGGGADGVMPIWRNLTGSAALALVAEFVRNFTALFVKIGFLALCGPTFLVEFLCAYDVRMFQHVYILFLIFPVASKSFQKRAPIGLFLAKWVL